MGFEYERGLPHQSRAIESISGIFEESVCKEPKGEMAHLLNPTYTIRQRAIERVQRGNGLQERGTQEGVFDICMETGTGKTYTYTKMMYELYTHFALSKFVLIVPSVAIRLGALKFLDSADTKRHFRDEYGCELEVYELSSQKNRGKKSIFPSVVSEFFESESKSGIQVLLINHGMLTSPSIEETYDKTLYDRYDNVFEAIGALNAVGIIDEPHRFKEGNKGWEKIKKLGLQMIFRFGATFENKYKNLIYELNAFEAFRQDLVKGIVTEVYDFSEGKNEYIRLKKIQKGEVEFELEGFGGGKTITLKEKDSLGMLPYHERRAPRCRRLSPRISPGTLFGRVYETHQGKQTGMQHTRDCQHQLLYPSRMGNFCFHASGCRCGCHRTQLDGYPDRGTL